MTTTIATIRSSLALQHSIPFTEDVRGPIPSTAAYAPARKVLAGGLTFSGLTLLHAIGCKTARVPQTEADRCVFAAYALAELIDFGREPLRYRRRPEPDFQAGFSQRIGVGVTCIVASTGWSIPWDQLQPIPGRGKRFDYRGENDGLRCIFESKGTCSRSSQRSQIGGGLEKKQAHRHRGDRADVELILSTCIGHGDERPRTVAADPPMDFDERAFGPEANRYFRLRHYVRVLQFIGAASVARQLYLEAAPMRERLFGLPPFWQLPTSDPLMKREIPTLVRQDIEGAAYVGIEVNAALYSGTAGIQRTETEHSLRLFQGLREDIYAMLSERNYGALQDGTIEPLSLVPLEGGDRVTSIFPDGSILSASEHTS